MSKTKDQLIEIFEQLDARSQRRLLRLARGLKVGTITQSQVKRLSKLDDKALAFALDKALDKMMDEIFSK